MEKVVSECSHAYNSGILTFAISEATSGELLATQNDKEFNFRNFFGMRSSPRHCCEKL